MKTCALVALVLVALAAGCAGGGSDEGPETFAARDLTRPGKLRICIDPSRPPMVYRGADGELRGFEVDLLEEVAALYELEPVWFEATYTTLIDSLASGKCDLIASALTVRYDYQSKIAVFPYLTAPIGLLVRDEDVSPFALGLCGRDVGALERSLEAELIRRAEGDCSHNGRPPPFAVFTDSTDLGLGLLRDKEIEVLIDDRPITNWFARRQTDLYDDGGTLSSQDNVVYAIGYGIGKNTLFSGIQGALYTLTRNGTIAELFARWGLEDAGVKPLRLS